VFQFLPSLCFHVEFPEISQQLLAIPSSQYQHPILMYKRLHSASSARWSSLGFHFGPSLAHVLLQEVVAEEIDRVAVLSKASPDVHRVVPHPCTVTAHTGCDALASGGLLQRDPLLGVQVEAVDVVHRFVAVPASIDVHAVLIAHRGVSAAALGGCAGDVLGVLRGHLDVLLGGEVVLDDRGGSPRVDEPAKDVHLVVVEDRAGLGEGFEVAHFLPLVCADVVFPEIGSYTGDEVALFRRYVASINIETILVSQSSVAYPHWRSVECLDLMDSSLPEVL